MTTFLSLDSVRAVCPSAFAVKPSPKVSDRYTFVSTADVLKPLLSDGWGITLASQRRVRPNGRDPAFTRHMVRLRRTEMGPARFVGDSVPEVIVSNSHDRQSRFLIHAGFFRMVCSNGLIVADGDTRGGTMTHLGDIARIHALIDDALTRAIDAGKLVARMAKRKMDEKGQARFASKAAELAYDAQTFDPKLLLAPRREADQATDLWTIYNRVQENLVRGGVKYLTTEKREVTTRGITHIGRSIDLNTGLWSLATEFLPKAA